MFLRGGLFKFCVKCQADKPPEGGIELGPSKYVCAECWKARARKK